jgi:hypothetical protein
VRLFQTDGDTKRAGRTGQVDTSSSEDVFAEAVEASKNEAKEAYQPRYLGSVGRDDIRLQEGLLEAHELSPNKQSPRSCLLAEPRALQSNRELSYAS